MPPSHGWGLPLPHPLQGGAACCLPTCRASALLCRSVPTASSCLSPSMASRARSTWKTRRRRRRQMAQAAATAEARAGGARAAPRRRQTAISSTTKRSRQAPGSVSGAANVILCARARSLATKAVGCCQGCLHRSQVGADPCCPARNHPLQTVRSKDGSTHYTVFDKCAVRWGCQACACLRLDRAPASTPGLSPAVSVSCFPSATGSGALPGHSRVPHCLPAGSRLPLLR